MHIIRILLAVGTLGVLSACGDTLGEQAVIGAGAGGATAAALDGDIVTGAAVGVAANIAYCRKYPSRC